MSKIECKYKYKNIEKFNGEKYCLCFNDLCKNLAFACDKNCQIFEDYKQLQQLKAEIAGLQSLNDFNIQKIEVLEDKIERINETAHWSMDEVDSGLKNILRNIQEICND